MQISQKVKQKVKSHTVVAKSQTNASVPAPPGVTCPSDERISGSNNWWTCFGAYMYTCGNYCCCGADSQGNGAYWNIEAPNGPECWKCAYLPYQDPAPAALDTYAMTTSGTCEDIGAEKILDLEQCRTALRAMGYFVHDPATEFTSWSVFAPSGITVRKDSPGDKHNWPQGCFYAGHHEIPNAGLMPYPGAACSPYAACVCHKPGKTDPPTSPTTTTTTLTGDPELYKYVNVGGGQCQDESNMTVQASDPRSLDWAEPAGKTTLEECEVMCSRNLQCGAIQFAKNWCWMFATMEKPYVKSNPYIYGGHFICYVKQLK